MSLQFSPMIILYFLAALITALLAYHTWKMRPTHGASLWAFVMLFASISAFAYGLESMFVKPDWKFAMIPLIYLGSTGLVFFWGLFCITYSNYQKWLNKFTLSLLAILPFTTFILALFVGQHRLIYQAYEFIEYDGLIMGHVKAYGSYFWVWASYTYAVLIGSAILMVQAVIRFPALYQGQVRMLILSVLLPVLVGTLYILGYSPFGSLDMTPIAITVAGILMLFAMKRYQFLDLVPVAHDVIFNNMVTAFIIIDTKERISNMNRAAENIFKKSRDQFIGISIAEAFPEYPDIRNQLHELADTKTEISVVENTYELKITPLLKRRGSMAGHIIMLYNITERVKFEQKEFELAVEKERVQILREFIGNASHDLKTPLTTMKTYHFLLRRQLGDSGTERIDILDAQTTRLIKLIDDMLTMVRLDDQDETTFQLVDINAVIRQVINPYSLIDAPKLQFTPESEPSMLYANAEGLTLLISNLISNAIRNTAIDGEISISTSQKDKLLQLRIKDTGTGISEDHLPRIFDRFYRVDEARNTDTGTSGLGLAIVKRVVEQHQGQIEVHSKVGEGTEFCIDLPLLEQDSNDNT